LRHVGEERGRREMSVEMLAGTAGVAVFLATVMVVFNRLVRRRYVARSAWSDISVHLKKRYDLVPNLVETVKGYAAHENATLTRVAEMRAAAMRARTPGDKGRAEQVFAGTLQALLAVAEAYPALKADAHFQELMTQLRQLEDNIEYARRYYNAAVRDYNITASVFPSNIVAAAFSFTPEEFFELDTPDVEGNPVEVSFPGPAARPA
jgi:LemA protein